MTITHLFYYFYCMYIYVCLHIFYTSISPSLCCCHTHSGDFYQLGSHGLSGIGMYHTPLGHASVTAHGSTKAVFFYARIPPLACSGTVFIRSSFSC